LTEHQAQLKDSVYKTYEKAALSLEWTQRLKENCDECSVVYFTTPYDIYMIDYLEQSV